MNVTQLIFVAFFAIFIAVIYYIAVTHIEGDKDWRAKLVSHYKMIVLVAVLLVFGIVANFQITHSNKGKDFYIDTYSHAQEKAGIVVKDKSATKEQVVDEYVEDEVRDDETNELEEVASNTEMTKPADNPKPVEVEVSKPVLLSNDVIAKQVLEGKWGNGGARKVNLESEGYNYAEIQAEVDKLAPKPKPKPTQTTKPTVSKPSSPSQPVWRANTIYMSGVSMPYITSNYTNMQADIDRVRGTWVTAGDYPVFNGNDNHGTYFAAHNYYGGDNIMKLGYGSEIVVTDSGGVPHTYIVDNIIRNNKQTNFDDVMSGGLNKEYIIFQTCEYPETKGNIHVYATKR